MYKAQHPINIFFEEILFESKNHHSFLPIVLLLVTLPLHNGLNNVMLVLYALSVIFSFKRENAHRVNKLFPLIALFFLTILSLTWSIDLERSLKALPRFTAFLLVPVLFMLSKPFSNKQLSQILRIYSYSIVVYCLFFLLKALSLFIISQDVSVFFFHGLVPKELNAVHVSVYVGMAFFILIQQNPRSFSRNISLLLLFVFMVLLSAYAILITFLLLFIVYLFYFTKTGKQLRLRNLIVFILFICSVFFTGKIQDSIESELKAKSEKSINHTVIAKEEVGLKIVSIKEAWSNEKFSPNDFFPGTAFRVYQARLFFELFQEGKVFWTGFGLNASFKKLQEKANSYNVFQGNEIQEGYQNKNFHNQYIQNFAELGFFGFLILLLLVGIVFKNALQQKDFIQIAFAVLMISLFLTESFLWRQRGVVFFTAFYCLFTATQLLPTKKD